MLGPSLGNSHSWSLQAGWEPDLWGRARRAVEGASDNAEASDADLAAARLAIQAEVANDYILLRVADTQQQLYARTVEAYQKSLQITQSQYRAGVVTRADVDLANTTLQSTQAQAIRHRNRAPAGRTRHRGAVGQDAIAVFDSPALACIWLAFQPPPTRLDQRNAGPVNWRPCSCPAPCVRSTARSVCAVMTER